MAHAELPEPAAADILDDFAARMMRAVPDPAQHRAVLSVLANGRGITETPDGGIAPQSLCHVLEQEGVVSRRGRVRNGADSRYALHRPYSAMFAAMRNRQDCPSGPAQ